MRKKILITGGMGFVGSLLSTQLAQRDDLDITILDNLLSGDILEIDNTRLIIGDIRNKTMLREIISEFHTIIHLAAIVGEPACVIHPEFAYAVNVEGTKNILDSMRKGQRIIFTSTSSIYGNRPGEVVTELSQPIPINNYGHQKYINELHIHMSGIAHVIVRPVTAFGITERTRLDLLVNTLIYNALSSGQIEVYEPNIMRPIIHVEDFVRVLIAALDEQLGVNQTYNIGDTRFNMTKLQLATAICSLTGAKVKQVEGSSLDPRNYDVSFKKLEGTGFLFTHDRLKQAVDQIKSAQYTIAQNTESFSTPNKVRLFLQKEQ